MRDRILAVYDTLRPSERRPADYVARHGASVIRLSMPELAERAGVSQPTIARFCAALGYDGFREFKLQFAQNVGGGTPSCTGRQRRGPSRRHRRQGLRPHLSTLMSVRNALSADQIEHGIRLLADARRIEFYGCGNSGIVALDLQHKFFRLGIPTTAYSDPHVFNMSAALLRGRRRRAGLQQRAHWDIRPPPRWRAAAAPACWRSRTAARRWRRSRTSAYFPTWKRTARSHTP